MQNHVILCVLTALTACQLKLAGASCPCADGWVCCTDRQVCVPDGTSCAAGGDPPGDADSGTDGGTDPGVQQLDLVLGRTGDHFGSAVASRGDVVAIGAPDRDSAGPDAGAVELYQRRGGDTGVWVWLGELVAPDPQNSAGFGSALAFANDQLLVGAPHAGSGAVYVYGRGPDGWAWSQTIAADVTGVPANQLASLGFGSHLAADQALAVIGTARAAAHVYRLSDTAVHLATLATLGTPGDELGDCATCGAVAIHGTTVVLATEMLEVGGVRVAAFDAAQDWARTELTEMLGSETYIAVALDADRLAVSRADTLRILERTAAGWGAPQDIALGAMFATDLAWRSTDLVMTAYHPHLAAPFLVHTVQRTADTWQVDAGTVIADRGAGGQFNQLAVSGDWVATGNPSARVNVPQAGQANFVRYDGSTVAETAPVTLDDGGLARLLAVGDGRILSTAAPGYPQAHWFERSPDGAFRRRPSLAGDPQSNLTMVAVSGNHALVGLHRRDGTVVAQSYELDHGDWTAHEQLTAPTPGDGQLARSIALSGDTALVAPYTVASGAPVAFVYTWGAGGWTRSSQLTWSGPPCPIVEVYLDGATAIVQCHDDAHTVAMYRRDETGWQPSATPRFPDDIAAAPRWLISGDRVVMTGGATTNGQTVYASHVFRWSGGVWSLEHSVVSDPLVDCKNGCTRGIVALDGDRCVVVTGPTSATAERFVDGTWRADRELALPPAMRSAAATIYTAGLAGDQVILAVPGEEIAGRLASGALYVYPWPR